MSGHERAREIARVGDLVEPVPVPEGFRGTTSEELYKDEARGLGRLAAQQQGVVPEIPAAEVDERMGGVPARKKWNSGQRTLSRPTLKALDSIGGKLPGTTSSPMFASGRMPEAVGSPTRAGAALAAGHTAGGKLSMDRYLRNSLQSLKKYYAGKPGAGKLKKTPANLDVRHVMRTSLNRGRLNRPTEPAIPDEVLGGSTAVQAGGYGHTADVVSASGEDRKEASFLPLELFDDPSMDMMTPSEWVALGDGQGGPTMGRSLFFDGEYKMEACRVLDYAEDDRSFRIEFVRNGLSKLVKRFNLKFDKEEAERPGDFDKRVAAAKVRRAEAEAQLRYHLYLEDQPTADITSKSEADFSYLMEIAASDGHYAPEVGQPVAFEHNVEAAVSTSVFPELLDDYYRAMKKAIFDYGYLDEDERRRLSVLRLPTPEQAPEAPEKGVVGGIPFSLSEYNALGSWAFSGGNVLTTSPDVFNVLVYLRNVYADLLGGDVGYMCSAPSVFEAQLEASLHEETGSTPTFPFALDSFGRMQEGQLQKSLKYLQGSWVNEFVAAVRRCAPLRAGEGELQFHNEEEHLILLRFLRCASLVMSDQLRDYIIRSLQAYTDFVSQFELSEGVNAETQELDVLSPRPALFKAELLFRDGTVTLEPSLDAMQSSLESVFVDMLAGVGGITSLQETIFPGTMGEHKAIPVPSMGEKRVQDLFSKIQAVTVDNLVKPQRLVDSFAKYQDVLSMDTTAFLDEYKNYVYTPEVAEGEEEDAAGDDEEGTTAQVGHTLDEYKEQIVAFLALKADVEVESVDVVGYELVEVSTKVLKHAIASKAEEVANGLLQQIVDNLREEHQAICDESQEILSTLQKELSTPEEMERLSEYANTLGATFASMQERIDAMRTKRATLESFKFDMSQDDANLAFKAYRWPNDLTVVAGATDARIGEDKRRFQDELQSDQTAFVKVIDQLQKDVDKLSENCSLDDVEENADRVRELSAVFEKTRKTADLYNAREKLFDLPETPYPQIADINKVFEPYKNLWMIANEFINLLPVWLEGPFLSLNGSSIDEDVENWFKTMNRLARSATLPPAALQAADTMRERIKEFKANVPVVVFLRNDGLRHRHWEQVGGMVGEKIVPNESLTLKRLLDIGIGGHTQALEEISEIAGKEHSLEKAMDKMEKEWAGLAFEVKPFKASGTYILAGLDDIQAILDDHIVKTQTMRGSPYIKPFNERIIAWEARLMLIQETIDQWIKCQISWCYLEPIFQSDDIMQQIPAEGRRFTVVNSTWRKTMEKKHMGTLLCLPSQTTSSFYPRCWITTSFWSS